MQLARTVVSYVFLFFFLTTPHTEGQIRGTDICFYDRENQEAGLYTGSYALVIGMSQYTHGWPSLESVPGEIELVTSVLEEQGFQVSTHLNLKSVELKKVFDNFINRYGYGDENLNNRLLFFFSGHGYTRSTPTGKRGYIVPVDAPNPSLHPQNAQKFPGIALSMDQIVTWARLIEAKHALFLFDSCFSGTIFEVRALPDIPPYISQLTNQPVREFITGGNATQMLPARSVFTPIFVNALRLRSGDLNQDGYVTGMELGLYLQSEVQKYATQTPQTPQFGKIMDPNMQGDFVFILSTPPTPTPTPLPTSTPTLTPPCPTAKTFWPGNMYPTDYVGKVWIWIEPQNQDVNQVRVVWGAWECSKPIHVDRNSSVSVVFSKNDPGSVPLDVYLDQAACVTFGTGYPAGEVINLDDDPCWREN